VKVTVCQLKRRKRKVAETIRGITYKTENAEKKEETEETGNGGYGEKRGNGGSGVIRNTERAGERNTESGDRENEWN